MTNTLEIIILLIYVFCICAYVIAVYNEKNASTRLWILNTLFWHSMFVFIYFR